MRAGSKQTNMADVLQMSDRHICSHNVNDLVTGMTHEVHVNGADAKAKARRELSTKTHQAHASPERARDVRRSSSTPTSDDARSPSDPGRPTGATPSSA